MYLIMEYCNEGNLEDYILNNKDITEVNNFFLFIKYINYIYL